MRHRYIGLLLIVLVIVGIVISFAASNSHHTIKTSAAQPTKLYVALGDSVAAGIGLQTYTDSSACDRTEQSYPNVVAANLHFKLINLACSGATLSSGILGQQNVNGLEVAPQINRLFTESKPTLISITIGANDIDWTGIITKCYESECGTPDDSAAVDAKLTTVKTNLATVLNELQAHYKSNPPDVVITGYHQVFPTAQTNCTDLTNIDASELAWGRLQQQNLSEAVQSVANQYTFVKYTPVNFTGHELCTASSWVQGLNDPDPYHPTKEGQQQFASQVAASYRAFK